MMHLLILCLLLSLCKTCFLPRQMPFLVFKLCNLKLAFCYLDAKCVSCFTITTFAVGTPIQSLTTQVHSRDRPFVCFHFPSQCGAAAMSWSLKVSRSSMTWGSSESAFASCSSFSHFFNWVLFKLENSSAESIAQLVPRGAVWKQVLQTDSYAWTVRQRLDVVRQTTENGLSHSRYTIAESWRLGSEMTVTNQLRKSSNRLNK